MPSAALAQTLDLLVPHLAQLADPWRLFGSAAMELCGAPGVVAADVDLLVSEADADRLITALAAQRIVGGTALFRSAVFGKATSTPLPVEIMAGFEVFSDGAWRLVRIGSAQTIDWRGAAIFIPEVTEQIALCRLFGREKDAVRARALATLLPSPPAGEGGPA